MPNRHPPKTNHLLAAMPEPEWQCWLPEIEWVSLPLGHVLYDSGITLEHGYLPTTAIVSLLYVLEEGLSAGDRSLAMRTSWAVRSSWAEGRRLAAPSFSVRVNNRMKASFIEDEFMRAPVLHLLLRSTQALLTQMTQTACAIDTIHWTSSFGAGCC